MLRFGVVFGFGDEQKAPRWHLRIPIVGLLALLLLLAAFAVAQPAGAVGFDWVQGGGDIDGEAADDESGSAVAISADGRTVAVGAPYNDANGNVSGHVRIFRFTAGGWTQLGQDIDGEAGGDFSGGAVAISADGDTVIIGARLNDGNGLSSGHARIFDWDGTTWTQRGNDIDGEAEGDRSGSAVAISDDGDTVIIGAPENDGSGLGSGHARIFDWDGTTWTQRGQDIDGEASDDSYGEAVAISADGNAVAIGAPFNDGNGPLAGHVRVFTSVCVDDGFEPNNNPANGAKLTSGVPVVGQVCSGADALDFYTITANAGDTINIDLLFSHTPGDLDLFLADEDGNVVTSSSTATDDEDIKFVATSTGDWTILVAGDTPDVVNSYELTVTVTPPAPPALCNGLVVDVNIGLGETPTTGDDVILGTSGNDVINALGGDDTICGEGGEDTLTGGPGDDTIFGGDSDDVLSGQGGDDDLFGEAGIDRINGGAGADTLTGGDGDDDLRGQGGDDDLFGEAGIDQFFGGSGADEIHTGDGGNAGTTQIVQGQGGPDLIFGSPQDDVLDGSQGQDEIHGGDGDDILNGGRSGDDLFGDAGNDQLFGGPDRDTLSGGPGTDDCNGGGATNDTADATCETTVLVP